MVVDIDIGDIIKFKKDGDYKYGEVIQKNGSFKVKTLERHNPMKYTVEEKDIIGKTRRKL